MTKEELRALIEKLYFDYMTEDVNFDISDGDITITIKTFLRS